MLAGAGTRGAPVGSAHALCPACKMQRVRPFARRLRRDEADAERLSDRALVRNPTRPQLLILASGGQTFAQCATDGAQRGCNWRGHGWPGGPTCPAGFATGVFESRCLVQGRYHFYAPRDTERGRCPSRSHGIRRRHARPQSIVSPAGPSIPHDRKISPVAIALCARLAAGGREAATIECRARR